MSDGYEILSVDDLDRYPGATTDDPVLMPLRRRLGFRPFGVNCWTASRVGGHVIERHSEPGGEEELYVVLRGRAEFTVGEQTFDAPPGMLVHVPGGTVREAVALEEGTLVLAAGAKPGESWRPAPWEDFAIAFSLVRAGDPDAARALVATTLAAHPGAWQGSYNAACLEALAGDADAAFEHLRRAAALDTGVAELAAGDADLTSLRDDPRWPELLG